MPLFSSTKASDVSITAGAEDQQQQYIPFNKDLKRLGVTKFVKQGDLVQIVVYKHKIIFFNIHPKELQKTMRGFRESALNGTASLSQAIVTNMEKTLVHPSNGYVGYLVSNGKYDNKNKNSKPSAAAVTIALAEEYCEELFIDNLSQPFAAVKINGHIEVIPLKSKKFRHWLSKLYYDAFKEEDNTDVKFGKVLSTESQTNAINVLIGNAEFSGKPNKQLYLRVAKIKNENDNSHTILYDQSDPNWQAVKVTDKGWIIVNAPPIFRRYPHQRPQVIPVHTNTTKKGTIDTIDIFEDFLTLLNIKRTSNNKLLFLCYIISLFYYGIVHASLTLWGPTGSAKTTLQELIRLLVDPSACETLDLTQNKKEMIQLIAHHYICYFDNVSTISQDISNLLCRAITGEGQSKRELFTDDDDIIYVITHCLGLNGLNLVVTKSDLLDRSIIIEHEAIPDRNKKQLRRLKDKFNQLKPKLLGYIFDVLVKVLRYEKKHPKELQLKEYSRLADFVEVCEIISRCTGHKPGEFFDSYKESRLSQIRKIVESNPVAKALVFFVKSKFKVKRRSQSSSKATATTTTKKEWTGSMESLYKILTDIAKSDLKIKNIKNGKVWPQAPNALSRKINKLKDILKCVGVSIEVNSTDTSYKEIIIEEIKPVTTTDNTSAITTTANNISNINDFLEKKGALPKI